MELELPIKSYTMPKNDTITDKNKIKEFKDSQTDKNIAFEIDLTQPK